MEVGQRAQKRQINSDEGETRTRVRSASGSETGATPSQKEKENFCYLP